MVLDRTDDEDTMTLPSPVSSKQFIHMYAGLSDTHLGLYGYSGVILEVNEFSQVVAVTLF